VTLVNQRMAEAPSGVMAAMAVTGA
jgi:hypothetical protein